LLDVEPSKDVCVRVSRHESRQAHDRIAHAPRLHLSPGGFFSLDELYKRLNLLLERRYLARQHARLPQARRDRIAREAAAAKLVGDPSVERFRDPAGLLCVASVDRHREELPQ
jgi:hypothetical protein